MEKTAKHTATPWTLLTDEENAGKHPYHDNRFLVAKDDESRFGFNIIAKFTDGNMADRSFIIKAVNNHEALLEACRNAKDTLEYLLPYFEKLDKENGVNWRGTKCNSVTTETIIGNIKALSQATK